MKCKTCSFARDSFNNVFVLQKWVISFRVFFQLVPCLSLTVSFPAFFSKLFSLSLSLSPSLCLLSYCYQVFVILFFHDSSPPFSPTLFCHVYVKEFCYKSQDWKEFFLITPRTLVFSYQVIIPKSQFLGSAGSA